MTERVPCTDLYKLPDAVPPIHAESYHVATDKVPSIDGGKFRSIFSDNLQPIATRGKKARSMLLVDQHCGNGCSIKRPPLSVSYYNCSIYAGYFVAYVDSDLTMSRNNDCARVDPAPADK